MWVNTIGLSSSAQHWFTRGLFREQGPSQEVVSTAVPMCLSTLYNMLSIPAMGPRPSRGPVHPPPSGRGN